MEGPPDINELVGPIGKRAGGIDASLARPPMFDNAHDRASPVISLGRLREGRQAAETETFSGAKHGRAEPEPAINVAASANESRRQDKVKKSATQDTNGTRTALDRLLAKPAADQTLAKQTSDQIIAKPVPDRTPKPAKEPKPAKQKPEGAAKPVKEPKPARQVPERQVAKPIPDGSATPVGSTILRTLASAVVPMSGLINTRKRKLALIVVGAFIVLVTALVVTGLVWPTKLIGIVVHSGLMRGVAIACGVFALLWVVNIVGTYLVNRPSSAISRGQRVVSVVVAALLCSATAVPWATASVYSWQSASLAGSIFAGAASSTTPSVSPQNPWGGSDRVNILLLGGAPANGGADTTSISMDFIAVASVSISTGATVMVQLAPNMAHTPFPPGSQLAQYYPFGFFNTYNVADVDYSLGAIWRSVPSQHSDLFAGSKYPGADALKLGVGTTLGLTIDYFMLMNTNAMQQLVDAMGGVTVNVNSDIPIGGTVDNGCQSSTMITHGANQRLDGKQATWYANSTCLDPLGDAGRMLRQRCLMSALFTQASPLSLITRYQAIAAAIKGNFFTDIPQSVLPSLVDVLGNTKGSSFMDITFAAGQNGFYWANPNFAIMQRMVQMAIDPSADNTDPNSPGMIASSNCDYNPQS